MKNAKYGLSLIPLLALSISAFAADNKVFNTYACEPFGTTVATDLRFDRWGVTNISSTPKAVVCPLERDGEQAYGGANAVTVSATYRAGGQAGTIYCSTYESNRFSFASASSVFTTASYNAPWQPRWTAGEASMTITSSSANGQLGLLCTLTPDVTLGPIRTYESGATD